MSHPKKQNAINFFCDCQPAIQALTSDTDSYPNLKKEIHQHLKSLQQDNQTQIHMYWTPGHTNIPLNDEADRLARIGAKHAKLTIKPHSLSTDEAKGCNQNLTKTIWNRRWNLIPDANNYKSQIKNVSDSNIMQITKAMPPHIQKMMIRLRVDHTHLPSHKAIVSQQVNPACSKCKTTSDVKHLLLECQSYNQARTTMLDNIEMAIYKRAC